MNHEKLMGKQRRRRRNRVRNRVRRDASRPRLSIFRSHKHIYAQVIDDEAGRTLVAVGTAEKEIGAAVHYGGNKAAATAAGKALAERALSAGIKEVAFDRREYRYHGRVAAFADGARQGGLVF